MGAADRATKAVAGAMRVHRTTSFIRWMSGKKDMCANQSVKVPPRENKKQVQVK